MKTVTLDVRGPGTAMKDFVRVWKTGKPEKSARISFASPDLLWKVLTAKRWELLKALCGDTERDRCQSGRPHGVSAATSRQSTAT